MATLSRVKTFITGDKLTATQANDIQDLLIDLFDGTTANVSVKLVYGAADAPTLTLNNTGSGVIASFKVGGVEKAKVNANGQIESTISTGTAPLVVASTTEVANLKAATATNADQLGGIAAANYITSAELAATTFNITHTWFVEQPDLGGVHDADYALIGLICPFGASYTLDRVRYVFASGTPTGNSTIDLKHYDGTGTLQNTVTVTLNSGDTAGLTYDANFADITMTDGDYVILTAGTDNGHRNISFQLEGNEEVTP